MTILPSYVKWAAEATKGSYQYEMRSELRWTSTTKLENLGENRRKRFAHDNHWKPRTVRERQILMPQNINSNPSKNFADDGPSKRTQKTLVKDNVSFIIFIFLVAKCL